MSIDMGFTRFLNLYAEVTSEKRVIVNQKNADSLRAKKTHFLAKIWCNPQRKRVHGENGMLFWEVNNCPILSFSINE